VKIRDRIKSLRRVKASELIPNPKNPRRHPESQRAALRGVLDQIGYADALLARELPEGYVWDVALAKAASYWASDPWGKLC